MGPGQVLRLHGVREALNHDDELEESSEGQDGPDPECDAKGRHREPRGNRDPAAVQGRRPQMGRAEG
jgi:hypothetical protein